MIHDVEQGAVKGAYQHTRERVNPMPIGDSDSNLILGYAFWAKTRSASELETTCIDSQFEHQPCSIASHQCLGLIYLILAQKGGVVGQQRVTLDDLGH